LHERLKVDVPEVQILHGMNEPANVQAKFDVTEERRYPCPRIDIDGLQASLGMIKTGTIFKEKRLRGVGIITVLPRVMEKI